MLRYFKLFCMGLALLAVPAMAAELPPSPPRTAIAMHGLPKYAGDFKAFSYVNPAAPEGGTLKLGVVGSFDSLNPFIIRGQPPYGVNTGNFSLVYETLLARSWDEPFTLYGLIAETVEVPEDRSSIIFNLNPVAHWQDGKPITADDILFSFETLRAKGRPNHRTYYKKVEKAERLDERRVKFTFSPNADHKFDREMPLIIGLMPVLPKHEWENRDFNQTSLRPPLGSGPYKVTKIEPGRSVTYTRDLAYWGRKVPAVQGTFNFDTVKVDFYRDDSIALQAFKAGQFDLRREPDPNKWATGYESAALKDGRLKLEAFEHHRPEAIYGFIFNTRKSLFQDPALRTALSYAFDFSWINRNLFHGLYKRTESFFPNSELAATGLPDGKELTILEQYKDRLPSEIFTTPFMASTTDGSEESLRGNLLKASAILKVAGYNLKDGTLYSADNQPVAFEVMLNDPMEEKVALQWARALQRIGISAHVRTVDSAQYQARLTDFDYEVTTGRWFNSLSPGNEQMFFWGGPAATQKGSRNYAGIRDPVVDALAIAIPAAATREDLVATVRALDRVLLAGNYVVPFYHLGVDQIAYWPQRLAHPEKPPVYGPILETWWAQH